MLRAEKPKSAAPDQRPPARSPVIDGTSSSPLLVLQRAAGNSAVNAYLQRCGSEPCACNEDQKIDDAPGTNTLSLQLAADAPTADAKTTQPAGDQNLTSPRFAAEPILEECFDDKARLGVGARGNAVFKVQQALFDLGFDLGPSGPDGIYGQATATAVKQFKTVHHLGFETFGDVGPGTMRKLDQLLPSAPAPPNKTEPTADETQVDECPVDADVVTALQDKGVGVTTTSATVEGAGAAPGHVSMFDSVRIFKSKVNISNPRPGENITDKGQFFWGAEIASVLSAEFTGLAGPGANDFVEKAKVVTELISLDPLNKSIDAKLAELDAIAKGTKDAGTRSKMQSLLTDTVTSAGNTIASFWTALDTRSDDSRPSVAAHATVRSFRTIRKFEKVGCFDHVGKLADRLRAKGGIKKRDNSVGKFADVVVGTHGFISDFRPILFPRGLDKASLDAAVDPTGDSKYMMGQVIKQQGVSAVVAAMRNALDAGQLIHVRVISGVGVGSTGAVNTKGKRSEGQLANVYEKDDKIHKKGDPRPISSYEEHSVLVIGYDGDLFVFNDPDASQSHSSVGGFTEAGFGFLAYDSANDRLGRGFSPAGMPVDKDGHNRHGEKRYQAISVHPA